MSNIELGKAQTNQFGESYYQSINNLTFKNASSENVFAPHYNALLEEEEALYIVVGTDSGLLYDYVKRFDRAKHCQFVFIEFDEVISELGLEVESNDWQGNVRLVNQSFDLSRLTMEFHSYVVRRRIHLIKSLAVMDTQPDRPYGVLWDKVEVAFVNYCRSEFNTQTHKVFEEQRILNAVDNWLPAVEINQSLKGKDAIILGGGPTLDDTIEWVKAHQDNLVIFAAARIAKRMEVEGILVDFFVTVDPFPWNFDNSKIVLGASEYSILAHSFHGQHRLLSQWNGLAIYMGDKFGWQEDEMKANIDTLGPTVTNSALHLACTLGAKRIFLSGIDFCYARGLTHESGSDEAKHSDSVAHHGKAMLEDNAGQMTETGDDFYSAKMAMENMIQFYLRQKPDLEFISLGLHSAKMKHVSYQSCNEIVLQVEDKQALMTDIKVNLTLTPEEKFQLAGQTLKQLSQQKKRFQKIKEVTDEALSVTDKLYGAQQQLNEKQAQKIKKLQKKVNHLVGPDGDYLASYQAAFFSDSYKPIDDEMNMTATEISEQLQAFFGGLHKVSSELCALLEKGIERANLRIEELKTNSLPSKCAAGWKAWKEEGRSVQWDTWHSKQLEPAEQEILQTAMDHFKQEFDKKDHLYETMLKEKVSNVAKLLMRANNAFAQGNLSEIETIIEHVEGLESNNLTQKEDFVRLLQGMAFELKQASVEAFNVYEPITQPAFRHIALKKMLPIAMNLEDYDAAITVLERLVQINLDYMVPYADMLSLLNNKQGGVEILKMYLEKFPVKLAVQNKLAQWHIDLAQFHEAKAVLDQVLSADSDNKTAEHLLTSIPKNEI